MTCENEKGGKTYSLKKLLEQYFFIIPEYQRDYAQGRDNERDVHVLDMFIKEITNANSKYDEHHHLLSIINPWGYNGLLPFKYKGVEFFLLPQGIILLSRIEDTTGLWENKDRWIYENFWNNLLSKDELLGKLNKIVEIKGISEK